MHSRFVLVLAVAAASVAVGEPPAYPNKSDLGYYFDERGQRHPARTPADWERRAAHVRAAMERVMGPLPTPSPEPLAVEAKEETVLRHYTRRHLTLTAEKGDRLPVYLLVPHVRDGKLPAMICLPGSSAPGKDTPAGLTPNAASAYAHELAERGFVCAVVDYPMLHSREYPTDPYKLGYVSATMKGVVNHRRAVDLLTSLPFVDGGAIGVIGHSLGGHNSLFLAAFDPRVKAVVSSCGFNVFAKHNGGNVSAWSSKYYMPRIKTEYGDDPKKIPFDFTEVLAAMAPRPVFVNAPLHDAPDFEVSGVRDCVTAALPIYRDVFKAADRLVVRYPDAGHTFPTEVRQEAYAFLDRHLRPASKEVRIDEGLIGRWPLAGNLREASGRGKEAVNRGSDLRAAGPDGKAGGAVGFDGKGAHLELPAGTFRPGTGDFSLAVWVHTDPAADDPPGEILSQYDPVKRRGFQLGLTGGGVTFSQPHAGHLRFGIDDNKAGKWEDLGRPGKAILAFALAVHDGHLYAGTCEPGKGEAGRVYRYAGPNRWIDLGAPAGCNSVTALAVHDGKLYAGVGKYRLAGSALTESENATLGGGVYRYENGKWIDCGKLPDAEAVGGLAVYKGKLYATSLYKPAGFFRYDGGTKWTDGGTPDGKRVEALTVFDGFLYASSYDGGSVFRYDGTTWTDCGKLGDNTQTYSFAAYEGKLYVGTWPSGRVYRFEGINRWTDVGRLGEEKEVMGMLVHNGRLLAGTLPLADVYQYEGGDRWNRLTNLDGTPDVKYRRAWTAAEFQGRAVFSTLPSGRVFTFEAGRTAAADRPLPSGWQHIVAVKRGGQLELTIGGNRIAASTAFDPKAYDLTIDRPVRIGAGPTDNFHGRMRDLRVYDRAISAAEVRTLAAMP